MPIRVKYNNADYCNIRPTPFVNISVNTLKNKTGNFGVTYAITLTGTLIPNHGSPFAIDPATNSPYEFLPGQVEPTVMHGPYGSFDGTPISTAPNYKPAVQQHQSKPASAILSKQRALRALFAKDGQELEITDVFDNAGATVVCYPRVVSVSFEEGQYVTQTSYTITLEADYLLHKPLGDVDPENLHVDNEGTIAQFTEAPGPENRNGYQIIEGLTIDDLLNDEDTAFIEDFSEDWSLEVDESFSENINLPRTYRISHSLSANGKTVYTPGQDDVKHKQAWEQAKAFVQKRLSYAPNKNYPNFMNQIGSGTVDLISSYRGFNHLRTENINEAAGTYSISESWILASGTSHENYSLSVNTSNSDPFVKVDINGTVKGMNEISPEAYGSNLDGQPIVNVSGAYVNALEKYNAITNFGQFGLTSDVYKRANNMVAVELNSQPISQALGVNQFGGEITYNLSFDNRPTNIIQGTVAETIQVNDTYPGDVFAVLPVLGRATGPVLQYIGGRTEYRRDVSINLTMDYSRIPYGNTRSTLLLKKPSLVEPTATQLASLINELSPAGEPGVRKYFVSAPTENWEPKTGSYTMNISWTYELDR